jgi:3-oxoacyl-[acyl-carrier protein] reductase
LSGKGVDLDKQLPAQRYGTALDIANCSLFLASEAAGFITGTTFIVDGGQYLTAANFAFVDPDFVAVYKNSSKL